MRLKNFLRALIHAALSPVYVVGGAWELVVVGFSYGRKLVQVYLTRVFTDVGDAALSRSDLYRTVQQMFPNSRVGLDDRGNVYVERSEHDTPRDKDKKVN